MQATPQSDPRWAAVLARDARAEQPFFYAVRSTGIFCRPSCPSRRPKPENVEFFASCELAQQAGFRACHRCRPTQADETQALVREAVRLLDSFPGGMTLEQLGKKIGLSPFHLQRVFKRTMGVSPREYVRVRKMAAVRESLRRSSNVTDAIYDAGFNSSSRFYESAAHELGMQPKRWQKGGAGEQIHFTTFDSPLGSILIAATQQGICRIALGEDVEQLAGQLKCDFHAAEILRADTALQSHRDAVLDHLRNGTTLEHLPLDLRGSAFQCRIWKLLRQIPRGETVSYSVLAKNAGNAKATRAIARACATNPVAIAVPCHRVVGKDGKLSGYRWGVRRKELLLAKERLSR